MKKTFFILCTLMILPISTFAGQAPLDVKEFLLNSTPASCASISLGECDNGYCYGDPEAFLFGIRQQIPQNPEAHSFDNYSTDDEVFKTQYTITEDAYSETLEMSLYREAWGPTFPDRDGRNLGVTKFEYTIVKRISDGKIIFAREAEFVKKRTLFGSLAKKWKVNSVPKICKDE